MFINKKRISSRFRCSIVKNLLDEIFVKSRIINVEVGVISQSQRPSLISLTEALIILDITTNESNNWVKLIKLCFCFFTDGRQHKAPRLGRISPNY